MHGRSHLLASRPKPSPPEVYTALLLAIFVAAGCSEAPQQRQVEATYDKATGKLSQLTVDALKDGKPNVTSYMEGAKFLRIEIDTNEDGKVDRWEYYGSDQKLEHVGFSRANDGVVDAWAYQGSDGSVERVEVSTKRDGRRNRHEFYKKGALARAEEDTDADGRVDKWEEYESGALVTVSFDTDKSGKPTTTVDFRKR
jgi:hypothetical protein